MHRLAPLVSLKPTEIDAIVALYQALCPMPEGYYRARLASDLYDAVAYAERGGVLIGAQLLNDFVEDGRRHVYLGPLVSRDHAYLDLIAELIYALHASSGELAISIMAELQNPLVAVMLGFVFRDLVTPAFDGAAVPEMARARIETFEQRLDHVDEIDWATLTTSGSASMFRARPRQAALVEQFRERGVDFAAGKSQIMLIELASGEAARETQLEAAAARAAPLLLGDGGDALQVVLSWFQSLAPTGRSHNFEENTHVHLPV